ncbi:hypothetical protein GCM10027569_92260 [Flindersiella endophytica]
MKAKPSFAATTNALSSGTSSSLNVPSAAEVVNTSARDPCTLAPSIGAPDPSITRPVIVLVSADSWAAGASRGLTDAFARGSGDGSAPAGTVDNAGPTSASAMIIKTDLDRIVREAVCMPDAPLSQ